MERITQKMLERKVEYLNKLTGSPATSWTKTNNGTKANIGHFHLSGAYGGVALHRMSTEGGGVSDVFSAGHMTKRELFARICAFIDGYEFANNPDRY